ncbi:uncharacterized protein LOC141665190 [Apium graveolens]|uniref:uncharacterized protein LOC141665190 n=1 Tax=Apium graveolens TaxID=4045 RepID=UPI003D7B19F5
MEVYVNDMLVKSKRAKDYISDLAEMFHILRKYRIKLNPQKCVFGVESGKLLGFMVNHPGIEANPEKIKTLLDMKSLTSIKQVQSLMGRIAELSRFVLKSSDRCKKFFKVIKVMGKDFVWTSYCEEAYQKIEEQLGNPPMLAKPEEGETLILCLTVSKYSIRASLVREEEGRQSHVYYMNKRLLDAETRYTSMEKLVYAPVLAKQKLSPYFQAHRIEVRTAYPLRHILHKPESSGRMLKWAVELGQFDLEYCPCTTIKGHALADFILEFDSEVDEKAIVLAEPSSHRNVPNKVREEFPHPWWILHVDGAVNNNGAGAGIILVTPKGHHLMSAIQFKFYVTNNDAEYEALINGLKITLEVGVVNLIARSDSDAKLEGVPREENSNTDSLAKMGSQMDIVLRGQIPLEIQEIPSIPELSVFQIQEVPQETWMTPIHNYIRAGTFPEDKLQARCLRYQAAKYVEYDGVLYKRGFHQPLLQCVDLEEGNFILREVHGVCRFGISYKLISNNGKQFDSKELRKLYKDLNIKKDFTAVYHPQSNGQTEAIKKIIKHTLKAKLEEKKGD